VTDNIFCVRIAQKLIQTQGESKYSRFPFDRVYLGKKQTASLFTRMFRYHLRMTLDTPLLHALDQLEITRIRETTIIRDDEAYAGVIRPAANRLYFFGDVIKRAEDWIMVVPTHVKSGYSGHAKRKSELGYTLSRAVDYNLNTSIRLPTITLVTPTREIPIMCAVCRNVLGLQAGECIPGQPSCKRKIGIRVTFDPYNCFTPQHGDP